MNARCVAAAALVVGCGGDLDPPWQLDHDRIVAVRATPPAILTGERSEIDGLIAVKGATTIERPPETMLVVAPTSLAAAVAFDAGAWVVTAPDEAALAVARSELGLEPGAPVPLQLGVSYPNQLVGLKFVTLGATGANPLPAVPSIDGAPAPAPRDPIVVGVAVDVPLAIEALDSDEVNWLTSCGTMHDHDLPNATLRVEPEDPIEGELVVVVRDDRGGVAWQVWPIRAE